MTMMGVLKRRSAAARLRNLLVIVAITVCVCK